MEAFLVASSVLLWAVVGFNLLLTLALVRKANADGHSQQMGLAPGTPAPGFTAQTLDGNTVTLADYAGKKVVFLFISPYCDACKERMPEYQLLHAKARHSGVDMVLVNIIGDFDAVREMATELKLMLPLLHAPQKSNSFARDYKVMGTPFYCLVDEKGIVQSMNYPGLEAGSEWKKLVSAWNATEYLGQLTIDAS
ncbi:MAG: peroxiredoxin family protein [Chloroflexota bacterium]